MEPSDAGSQPRMARGIAQHRHARGGHPRYGSVVRVPVRGPVSCCCLVRSSDRHHRLVRTRSTIRPRPVSWPLQVGSGACRARSRHQLAGCGRARRIPLPQRCAHQAPIAGRARNGRCNGTCRSEPVPPAALPSGTARNGQCRAGDGGPGRTVPPGEGVGPERKHARFTAGYSRVLDPPGIPIAFDRTRPHTSLPHARSCQHRTTPGREPA